MNVETNRLKAKIKIKIERTNDRIHEIQEEMKRLENENPRLEEALKILETVERIAEDYETVAEPLTNSARRRDVSQSPVGPVLEKLRAEMSPQIPSPGGAAAKESTEKGAHAAQNCPADDSAEHDRLFAQWR